MCYYVVVVVVYLICFLVGDFFFSLYVTYVIVIFVMYVIISYLHLLSSSLPYFIPPFLLLPIRISLLPHFQFVCRLRFLLVRLLRVRIFMARGGRVSEFAFEVGGVLWLPRSVA